MNDSGYIFSLVMCLFLLINLQSCRISKLERDLARMTKLEYVLGLDPSEQSYVLEGSNPSTGTTKGGAMKKEVKHYENMAGKVILAYAGLSRPYRENEPFVEGYWILIDSYGSEQFIPKIPFEREYWEIKKPEK